jgi:hypothetical protein
MSSSIISNENEIGGHMLQSKFGLGTTHDDMIFMLLKYFRIVTLIYVAWLIGNYQTIHLVIFTLR